MFSRISPFSPAIGIDFDGPARYGVRVPARDLPARGKKAGHDPLELALAIFDGRMAADHLQPPLPASACAQT